MLLVINLVASLLYFFNFLTQILSVYWQLTVCISCFFFHPWAIHTFLKLTCIIYSTWFKFFTCTICICFWMFVYVEQFILWTYFHFKSSFSIAKNCYFIVWTFILILNLCPVMCYIVIYLCVYICVCVCVCVCISFESFKSIQVYI